MQWLLPLELAGAGDLRRGLGGGDGRWLVGCERERLGGGDGRWLAVACLHEILNPNQLWCGKLAFLEIDN